MGFGAVSSLRGKTCVLDYGIVSTSAKSSFGERLVQLANDLDELLDGIKPDRVAVEKLFFTTNAKTAMQVAEARGVILLAIARRNILTIEYTPSQVKSAVCGNGRANKKDIQKMVRVLLDLAEAPKIDDAADALALALVGITHRI